MANRKSYTLLKDLPDVKAGAIFTIGSTLDAYYLTSDKTGTKYNCYAYPLYFVETNPEWFAPFSKESKPIQDKDYEILSFRDTHVPNEYFTRNSDGKFGNAYHNDTYTEYRLIESKFPIQSVRRKKDNAIFAIGYVTNYGIIESFNIGNDGWMNVHFTDGCGATLNSIEHKPKTEYEIISYFFNGLHWVKTHGKYYNEFGSFISTVLESAEIQSVKRLSDNEVFSIGDLIDTVGYTGYPSKPLKRFFFKDDVLYVQFDEGKGSNDGCMGFNAIQKAKPKVLFTTDDGVEKFEGNNCWYVTEDFATCSWTKLPNPLRLDNGTDISNYKYFHDKEKAYKWVLENKPIQVNFKDILNFYERRPDLNAPMNVTALKEFFKSKINNG